MKLVRVQSIVAFIAIAVGGSTVTAGATPVTTSFLAESKAAMDKMMAGMAVKSSGHVDQDFVAMMVPHHQGAIDMAQSELRYGHNDQLRRIAQEIIVEQQQEIAAMRLAVGQPLPPSTSSPDQPSVLRAAHQQPASHQSMNMSHMNMSHMDMSH
jgi:Domain of unknown function (DUF305)